ncbi:MAG: MFS transporter [Lachnospiraceae bacterium]|nr:MFS transporter [Lachnospiraceae bacterium]
MKLLTRSDAPDASLGVVERSAYMLGNVGTAFVNTIIASFIMFFYTDVMFLDAKIIGSILLVSRILDGVTDIVMGMIVDRTHSRHGKGRVWVLRTCIPYAISGILLVCVPAGASSLIQYVYVFITYNLCNAICLTALYVPYNSMTSNMTNNPYERGILGVFVMAGAVIGTLAVQSTVDAATKALGGGQRAWQIVILVYALAGLLLHLICFALTKERCGNDENQESSEEKLSVKEELGSLLKNRYWVIAIVFIFVCLFATAILGGMGMYYAKAALGDTAYYARFANAISITQVISLCGAFILLKKVGKRNTMLIGISCMVAGCLFHLLSGTNVTMITIASGIKGFGAGFAAAGLYGMVADTIDYSDWKFGVRPVGVGSAGTTFATKIANGFSVVLIGWIIDASGYNPAAAVQSEETIRAISLGYTGIPMICGILGIILMCFYTLDKKYPVIQQELMERKQG